MKTAIVIPTYNERENIVDLTELILALPYHLHLVIVDDNSPDGTGEVVDVLAAQHERVCVIHRAGKLGLGTAYLAGFHLAFEMDVSHIMTMDADFSHHPRYIPDLLRLGERCDLVIGSRYVPGGGTRHWHWQRVLLSWGANRIAKLALGLRPNDCTAGFRLYRREVLESVDPDRIFSNGYSFLLEMLFKVQQNGWHVAEVPILFADRKRGASKISKNEIFKAGYTVLRLRWEMLRGDTM
ncbi:MAG: polyprenol monophosphomannose synthase [Chloroflexota bacterium]|nr:polyprenol monophosphomannose synthase [Chloroflexota bacterium]